MQIDAYASSGSSPGATSNPECARVGCAPRTDHHPFPDFLLADHGSIFLLQPITDPAYAWVADHLPADALTFGHAVAIEHRFVAEIVVGIRADGLRVRS